MIKKLDILHFIMAFLFFLPLTNAFVDVNDNRLEISEKPKQKKADTKLKKLMKKVDNLKKKKFLGLYILLPLTLLGLIFVLSSGIQGSLLIGILFLNAINLLGFFFLRKKGKESDIKLGNIVLSILLIVNLFFIVYASAFQN